MRHYIVLLFLLVAYSFSYSQDTIFLKNGDKIQAKVLEVDQQQIKYKKLNFLEGPIYLVVKKDVLKITYSNGGSDEFFTEYVVNKKMFIWKPEINIKDFKKFALEKNVSIIISDERNIVAGSKENFRSEKLVIFLKDILTKCDANSRLKFINNANESANNSVVTVKITGYEANFYTGMWHSTTRYVVDMLYRNERKSKEIEVLKNSFNVLGHATARKSLSNSFYEATQQLIEYIVNTQN